MLFFEGKSEAVRIFSPHQHKREEASNIRATLAMLHDSRVNSPVSLLDHGYNEVIRNL
jgi:hypothetical protein